MKIIFVILMNFIFYTTYSNSDLNINTLLIACEETENTFAETKDTAPFSDGIMRSMWEKSYIFFDIKLKQPLNIVYNQLDVNPFVKEAKGAGADSILMIKFVYTFKEDGAQYRLSVENVDYLLYSVRSLKVMKSGSKKLKINKLIDINVKHKYLKDLGSNVLNDIL